MAQTARLMHEAIAHLRAGRADLADTVLGRLLVLDPGHAEGNHLLGTVRAGQGDLEAALSCFQLAIRRDNKHLPARLNLAKLLFKMGHLDAVVACCRETVAILPQEADPLNILGAALTQLGHLEDAADVYKRAIRLDSGNPHLHHNLGNVFKLLGHPKKSAAAFRRSEELGGQEALTPLMDQLRTLCAWEELAPVEARVLAQLDIADNASAPQVMPFPLLMSAATAAQQRACAERYADRNFGAIAARSPWSHRPSKPGAGARRLTIGYLSADFHRHATAYLAAELFELHNRDRFQVFGYSLGPDDGSPMRQRIETAFDRFVDVKDMSFQQAAAQIHADGVDILVDLKGYTQNARPEILAMRPAPVQVNYLGYPGTMGASFMDYFVGDPFSTPLAHADHFSEAIVQLPDCYQINDRKRRIADVTPSRESCGLPATGTVFCCFNHLYKITPEVFGTWMAVLTAVPESVLWLLAGDADAMDNLRAGARRLGVDPRRLVFGEKRPLDEHLARIGLADLFLDTFPCNAHTTASDALWAGVPLLTYSGETFASRVAGSLLGAVGLEELICDSLDGYRDLAIDLGNDQLALAAIRDRLTRARDSAPLFDSGRFCRHLEAAYLAMWERFEADEPPAAICVEPLPG
jgi:predicted O-linked N-acetylglucosamine transferase (SPINDLY family)